MSRPSASAARAYALLLLAASAALAQPKGDKPPDGDEAGPALLNLIRGHLATRPGLRPSDGVTVASVQFFRGEVRISGRARTDAQRDALLKEVESIRAMLAREVDVRITRFDLSRFSAGDGKPPDRVPPSAKGPPDRPEPRRQTYPPQYPFGWPHGYEWLNGPPPSCPLPPYPPPPYQATPFYWPPAVYAPYYHYPSPDFFLPHGYGFGY